jgi:hypothetical protein
MTAGFSQEHRFGEDGSAIDWFRELVDGARGQLGRLLGGPGGSATPEALLLVVMFEHQR